MRTSVVATLLAAGLLSTSPASGQLFRRNTTPAPTPSAPGQNAAPAPRDPAVTPANNSTRSTNKGTIFGTPKFGGTTGRPAAAPGTKDNMVVPANALPEPDVNAETASPTVALSSAPIEPLLLTKDAGPFMVMAHTFRGPNAAKYAQLLAMELRNSYNLPAYVLLSKEFPGGSPIANIPPTAPEFVRQGQVTAPEKFRIVDEAAVLVGNEKTKDDTEKLLKYVKKIRPACLDGIPDAWEFRKGKGLIHAMQTVNPYVPAEQLFPRKPDVLIVQMNEGPHSVFRCPGNYSLQIAEFTGRSAIVQNEKSFMGFKGKSSLGTAAEDAERLAGALARDKDVQQMGYQPYVYHDRFSSKVLVGSFNAPNDPNAVKLRDRLIKLAGDWTLKGVTDYVIAPANHLTNVGQLKPK